MIEEKTIIEQIEVQSDGRVGLRFALLTFKNGVLKDSKWHRTAIEPGGDVDAQIAAVNADITTRPGLMAAPIDTEKLPLVKAICEAAHTPEVIASFRAAAAP